MICRVCLKDHPAHVACRPVDLAAAKGAPRETRKQPDIAAELAELRQRVAEADAKKAATRESTRLRVKAWRDAQKAMRPPDEGKVTE